MSISTSDDWVRHVHCVCNKLAPQQQKSTVKKTLKEDAPTLAHGSPVLRTPKHNGKSGIALVSPSPIKPYIRSSPWMGGCVLVSM